MGRIRPDQSAPWGRIGPGRDAGGAPCRLIGPDPAGGRCDRPGGRGQNFRLWRPAPRAREGADPRAGVVKLAPLGVCACGKFQTSGSEGFRVTASQSRHPKPKAPTLRPHPPGTQGRGPPGPGWDESPLGLCARTKFQAAASSRSGVMNF